MTDDDLREGSTKRLIAAGINGNRLQLGRSSPFAQMREEYNSIDIVLDTLTYSGGTTAFNALWVSMPASTADETAWWHRVSTIM